MPQRQPTPIFVPFVTITAMTTTEVSNIDEIVVTSEVAGNIPTDPNIPQIISNLNTLASNTAVDREVFDHVCQWVPMSSGHIVKMFINIAMVGDMSAFTDETITWDTTEVRVEEVGTGKIIFSRIYEFSGDVFNAADEVRLMIIKQNIDNQSFQVSQGVAINIRLITAHTQTGGGTDPTYVTGVTPFFPLTADTNSKIFSESGIVFYLDRDREKL